MGRGDRGNQTVLTPVPPTSPPVVAPPPTPTIPTVSPERPGATPTGGRLKYTKENFPYEEYFKTDPFKAGKGGNTMGQEDKDRAWAAYQKNPDGWTAPAPPPPPAPPPTVDPTNPGGTTITPGTPVPGTNQINIADYAAQVAQNPALGMAQDNPDTTGVNESQYLSDHVQNIDPNTAGTGVTNSASNDPLLAASNTAASAQGTATTAATAQGTATTAATAQGTAQTGSAQTTGQVDPRDATTYQVQNSLPSIMQNGQMTAAQGTVDQSHLIDAPQLDMQGTATGRNADGSVNQTGQALQQYASQNIANVIDTSTPSGAALAKALGDGNYTDSKATLKGQLDILQSEFQDANGNPKIPAWAAATARGVSKIAAFSGMTGTAATAAMAQALMEASIPVAQQDAAFFQTVSLQNLSNKQESTINRANVLAKFDLTNIDNRMAAAVENSKAFLAMDMANLDNRQQAAVINTQARVQAILEDSKQVNAQRLFTAQSQNDMDKFYDSLNSSIQQFNAAQTNGMTQFNVGQQNQMTSQNVAAQNEQNQFNANAQNQMTSQNVAAQNEQNQFNANAQNQMSQFNASELNDTNQFNANELNQMNQFNSQLENNRQQFYSTMQYNVDTANAKWRQTVTLQDNANAFEAAATDVKNMNTLSQEQLNQLWDRSDALLDYAWKSAESDADRQAQIAITKLQSQLAGKNADKAGVGAVVGSIAGKVGSSLLDWAFG